MSKKIKSILFYLTFVFAGAYHDYQESNSIPDDQENKTIIRDPRSFQYLQCERCHRFFNTTGAFASYKTRLNNCVENTNIDCSEKIKIIFLNRSLNSYWFHIDCAFQTADDNKTESKENNFLSIANVTFIELCSEHIGLLQIYSPDNFQLERLAILEKYFNNKKIDFFREIRFEDSFFKLFQLEHLIKNKIIKSQMTFQKLSKALNILKEKLSDVKNELISKTESDLLIFETNQNSFKINFPLSGNSDFQVSFVLAKDQITCDDQDKIKKLVSLVFEAHLQSNDFYFCKIAETIFYTFQNSKEYEQELKMWIEKAYKTRNINFIVKIFSYLKDLSTSAILYLLKEFDRLGFFDFDKRTHKISEQQQDASRAIENFNKHFSNLFSYLKSDEKSPWYLDGLGFKLELENEKDKEVKHKFSIINENPCTFIIEKFIQSDFTFDEPIEDFFEILNSHKIQKFQDFCQYLSLKYGLKAYKFVKFLHDDVKAFFINITIDLYENYETQNRDIIKNDLKRLSSKEISDLINFIKSHEIWFNFEYSNNLFLEDCKHVLSFQVKPPPPIIAKERFKRELPKKELS